MLKEIASIVGDTVATSISTVTSGIFGGIANGTVSFAMSVWPIIKEDLIEESEEDEENTLSETNQ